jgi:transforming growth factor-beta-induced protein
MFEKLNLVDTILKNPEFSTFASAITASGLVDAFKSKGPYTVLAPTNKAFNKFPEEMMTDLMKPENKENLANLLKYHVIEGKIMSEDINKLRTAKTLQGQEIRIDTTDGVKINGAKLLARNNEATNGVIHAIDTVLALANTAKVS